MIEPGHQLRLLEQLARACRSEGRRVDELHGDVDVEEPVPATMNRAKRAGAQHLADVNTGNRHGGFRRGNTILQGGRTS